MKKPTSSRAPMVFGYCRVSTPKQRLQRQRDNIQHLYPDAEIVTDEWTGTTLDRPGWNELKKGLIPGDVIIFDEVSRMARDAEHGVALYKELYDAGIELKFIKQPHVDTAVYRRAQARRIDAFDNVTVESKAVENYVKGQGELLNGLLLNLAWEQIELAFKAAEQEAEFLRRRTTEGVHKALERYEHEEAEGLPHEKNKPGQSTRATWTSKKSVKAKEIIAKHNRDFGGPLNDVDTMTLIAGTKEIGTISRNSYYKWKKELMEAQTTTEPST